MDVKLDKTANGDPWLLLGLPEVADMRRVAEVLERVFNAQERHRVIDPLGEVASIEFAIDSQPIRLDWDIWSGVSVHCEPGAGEMTLKRISNYFAAHPLPATPASQPTPWWKTFSSLFRARRSE